MAILPLKSDAAELDRAVSFTLPCLDSVSSWLRWYAEVEGLSRAWGIWPFVDPDGSEQLDRPVRPGLPPLPDFDKVPERLGHESAIDFQTRLQEYKFNRELLSTECATRQDRYRVDCFEYTVDLERFVKLSDKLEALNVAIYTSAAAKWRKHVKDQDASAPRSKLQRLRDLVLQSEVPNRNAALAGFHEVASRKVDNWMLWSNDFLEAWRLCRQWEVEEVSEALARETFLKIAAKHSTAFFEHWRLRCQVQQCRGTSVVPIEELVSEFQQSLPRKKRGDALAQAAKAAATRKRPDVQSAWRIIMDSKSTDDPPTGKLSPLIPSPPEEVDVDQEPWIGEPADLEHGETSPPPASVAGSAPPSEMHRHGDANPSMDGMSPQITNGYHKHTGSLTASQLGDQAGPVGQSRQPSVPPKHEDEPTPNLANSSSGQSETRGKECPGCGMHHRFSVDEWWKTCFVYWAYSKKKPVPNWFYVTEASLDAVKDWLEEHPEESDMADRWDPYPDVGPW